MENTTELLEDFEDPDFIIAIKKSIEKELAEMKKIVNNISQLRVAAAYLETDLLMTIDSSTWQDISQLVGLGTMDVMDGLNEEKS